MMKNKDKEADKWAFRIVVIVLLLVILTMMADIIQEKRTIERLQQHNEELGITPEFPLIDKVLAVKYLKQKGYSEEQAIEIAEELQGLMPFIVIQINNRK